MIKNYFYYLDLMKYRFESHVGKPVTYVVPSVFDRKVVDFVGENDLIEYEIKDGFRPDAVANELYDNPNADWTFFVINQMTPREWPLSNRQFNKIMNELYGIDGQYSTHHYEDDYGYWWYNNVMPSAIVTTDGNVVNHWVRRDIIGSEISFPTNFVDEQLLMTDGGEEIITEDGDNILVNEQLSGSQKYPYIVVKASEVPIREVETSNNERRKTILVIPPDMMPYFINEYVRASIVS